LQSSVAEAQRASIAAGETLREQTARIVAGVDSRFGEFKAVWADRIATTECAKAQMVSLEEAWVQSGVVQSKQWLAAGDCCDECLDLDGTDVGIREPFLDVGDTHTWTDSEGQAQSRVVTYEPATSPPLHPNCRCTLIEILVGE